jgi:hypothetical protein
MPQNSLAILEISDKTIRRILDMLVYAVKYLPVERTAGFVIARNLVVTLRKWRKLDSSSCVVDDTSLNLNSTAFSATTPPTSINSLTTTWREEYWSLSYSRSKRMTMSTI